MAQARKAAGAAGGVEELLAEPRIDLLDHELRDGAGRVVLARVARALEVAEDLLVHVAEQVAMLRVVEVDALLDLVDDLAQQRAGLHVVVGIFEDAANDQPALVDLAAFGEVLERREELVVDELQEGLAGHPLGVGRPVPPAERLGDGER